ncbi:unnamed protein product [Chrysodeixis includens]|uniref:CHK kinase-like domain-containing protein n=1 Tax=Chrysodeixis includens TaxID=689277 RepID=A0A9P0BVN3_CHRIL|nr:unnamed protein product [Chrysodeixis includens]
MSAISEEYLIEILQKVTSNYGLQDWSYNQVKFESIAQNYFGIILPIVLTGRHEEKEVKIQLVLKLAPTDERYRVSGAVTFMFAREIFVYSVILKKFEEIQRQFSLDLQYIIPQCYYIQPEYTKEGIAMQDMCSEGYRPYTHEIFLDLDHITISLKSLAKLHALSFIVKRKDTELYSEISKVCIPLTEQTNARFMTIMKDRLDKALIKFQNTEYIPLLKKLRQDCADFFKKANDSVESTCICHADIWKENIVFKYENKKPVSACIIDYQTTRICSPAFDTMYLIISSTSTELRQKHLPQLLDTYYQTFDQILVAGGLESQSVYTRQMLDKDLKTVSPACLITANTAMWLYNGLQEEGHVRSKQILNTPEERLRAANKYIGIVKGIIDDFSSHGYLSLNDL